MPPRRPTSSRSPRRVRCSTGRASSSSRRPRRTFPRPRRPRGASGSPCSSAGRSSPRSSTGSGPTPGAVGRPAPGAGPLRAAGREVVRATDRDAVADLAGVPHRSVGQGAAAVLAPDASVPPAVEATLEAVKAERISLGHSDPRRSPASFEALRAGDGPCSGSARASTTSTCLPDGSGPCAVPRSFRAVACCPSRAGGWSPSTVTPARHLSGSSGSSRPPRRSARGRTARDYCRLTETPVVPAFELIGHSSCLLQGQGTARYSRARRCGACSRGWQAAEHAGTYVVLDLQPGLQRLPRPGQTVRGAAQAPLGRAGAGPGVAARAPRQAAPADRLGGHRRGQPGRRVARRARP